MGQGPFFNSRYLSDHQILSTIKKIIEDRNSLFNDLAAAGTSASPAEMSALAKHFHELDKICQSFKKLDDLFKDLQELEIMAGDDTEEGEDLQILLLEYKEECSAAAAQLYRLLLEKRHISEELVDSTDLAILKFIEYAGPEYAWRLGINVGIGAQEARDRLQALLEKELLKKVQGTMLEGYHREKDWVKHMNHTYYRLSRKGKQFLRQLRII
ncbi:MAG: DUF2250 domain-containing protein [Desulfocucumaceae bacterium]